MTDQLLDAVAELLGTEPVHRQHGARWIDHEVHRGVVFEDGPPLFVALSQRFGGLLSLGDVVGRNEMGDGIARRVALQRPPSCDGDVRPVAPSVDELALPSARAEQSRRDVPEGLGPDGLQQLVRDLAERLVGRPSEQVLCAAIPVADSAVHVADEHGIVRQIQQ